MIQSRAWEGSVCSVVCWHLSGSSTVLCACMYLRCFAGVFRRGIRFTVSWAIDLTQWLVETCVCAYIRILCSFHRSLVLVSLWYMFSLSIVTHTHMRTHVFSIISSISENRLRRNGQMVSQWQARTRIRCTHYLCIIFHIKGCIHASIQPFCH